MNSAKVDVDVRHYGEDIGSRSNMPVRRRPDGIAGVVYSGLVYPLYPDHSIDLADEGIPKEECQGYFGTDEPLVYAASDEEPWWHLESTNRGNFLAFDGDDKEAKRLDALFVDKGLSRGCHRSFRPARNGHFYDFYIRLPSDVDEAEVERAIEEFEDRASPDDAPTERDLLNDLIARAGGVDRVLEVLNDWQERRAALIEAIEELRRQILARDQELASERRTAAGLKGELAALIGEMDELRKVRPSHQQPIPDQIEKLRLENIELQAREAALARKVASLEEEILAAEQLILEEARKGRQAEAALETERSENRPIQPVQTGRGGAGKNARRAVAGILQAMFPRIVMDGDDYDCLINEFHSMAEVIGHLATLQNGGTPKGASKFKGMAGVWEISDVSTGVPGRGRMGRLYFRHDKANGSVEVAIHIKTDEKNQSRFVTGRFC